ncbi:MAG: hypothetical protein BroJett003_01230 [Planctomycetota bacterium]|nr:MAG: hypothetical protein BroJett003_01230 [Planctomycetota bacterium]
MPTIPFQADELAIVEAIHDDPRSDSPRLAYADWLAARGERDLAEFIRLQCAEPYFGLAKQGDETATIRPESAHIGFDDPQRVERAIELLGRLHPGDRFPDPRLWQEYWRGLPLYERELDDKHLEYDVDVLCGVPSPLARYTLFVHTSQISCWLDHPILRFTNELRVFPRTADEFSESSEFTEDDIRLFAQSPWTDRLEKIGLSGGVSPVVLALASAILEPRVTIDYTY